MYIISRCDIDYSELFELSLHREQLSAESMNDTLTSE